ncbi:MAG TPA: sigma-54 dependent transcriptional regulator [candidate division Zixibacteria bacterium]|nr:sigma-54 dependent transcriptional regulator [candidate division Zixibacteria bacterium]
MAHPRPTVLVVDDDPATRSGLTTLLESWGYDASAVADGQAALQRCNRELPHAIVSDLVMPGMTGLEFLEALHERVHHVAVIMLTGQATIETAVQAIKLGAYDYLTKPLEPPKLRAILEKGLRQIGFAREASALRQRLESPLGSYGELIGKSPTMRALYKRLSQLAPTNAAVLVSGESGTGKELVARTLHDLSPRREQPFLALDCIAAAPASMEIELFGCEKGAFPDALERRPGCFERAGGGTLFLDEITAIAPAVQAKLLRVLEEEQVRRIGAVAGVPVAARVIAATSRSPAGAVKDGRLLPELFYRLNRFHLALPPLRERGEDIPLLARYYLESFGEKYQRPILPWAHDFATELAAYAWPGNVRELRDTMERLALLAPGPNLTAADLRQHRTA